MSFTELLEACWGDLTVWACNHQKVSSSMRPAVDAAFLLGCSFRWSPEASTSGLSNGLSILRACDFRVLSFLCSRSVLQKRVSANKVETALVYDLALEDTQHSVCYFLFVTETQACPRAKGGAVHRLHVLMDRVSRSQGRRTREMGGVVTAKMPSVTGAISQKISALLVFI